MYDASNPMSDGGKWWIGNSTVDPLDVESDSKEYKMKNGYVAITAAECHDGCLNVSFTVGRDILHQANINPVGLTTRWRVDCDDCFTCVRVLETRGEAILTALYHVEHHIPGEFDHISGKEARKALTGEHVLMEGEVCHEKDCPHTHYNYSPERV